MMYEVETFDFSGVRYVRVFENLTSACLYAEQFERAYIKPVKVIKGGAV